MNKLSSQIESHNLIKEVSDDLPPIFEKVHQDKDYAPSEIEQYSISVFKWVMRVMGCFETLEHARVYLSNFKTIEQCSKAGIGRRDYINYHYFNYAITVVRIMDVALILANSTFRLGNPEKLCRLEYITENSWVRSTGVDRLLKNLDAIVKPWREPRNHFVHRGEELGISGQRQDSDLLFVLGAADRLIMGGETEASALVSQAPLLCQSVVSGIFREFDQIEQPLLDATSKLLSGLLPIYRFWRKMLPRVTSPG